MNLREYYPALLAGGIGLLVMFLVGGAIAVGFATFGGSSDTTDVPEPSHITVPDNISLPPGYYSEGISAETAIETHLSQTSGLAYNYTFHHSPEKSKTVTTSLVVDENGAVTGSQTVTRGLETVQEYELTSKSGVTYVVSYKQNGTEARHFANRNYANGLAVVKLFLNHGNFSLQTYKVLPDGALYYYSFHQNNISGGLTVTDEGLIRRAYYKSTADDQFIKYEFTLTPRRN